MAGPYRVVDLLDKINLVSIAGGIVPTGDYDDEVNYNVGDMVTYEDVSYVMYVDAEAGTPPTNTDYWMKIGAVGAQGPIGPSGPSGPTGPSTLETLNDVSVTAHQNDDLLQYNSVTDKWENKRNMVYDSDYKAYIVTEK